jgi:hypothetical protein
MSATLIGNVLLCEAYNVLMGATGELASERDLNTSGCGCGGLHSTRRRRINCSNCSRLRSGSSGGGRKWKFGFTDIPPATAEKIAKLIVRIVDDNECEALAACRLIITTLRGAGCDLHDLARQIGAGREFALNDIMRSVNENIRHAKEQRREQKKAHRKAKSVAAEAARRRKFSEKWLASACATYARLAWRWAIQICAAASRKTEGGEPIAAAERNRVMSLMAKMQMREMKAAQEER